MSSNWLLPLLAERHVRRAPRHWLANWHVCWTLRSPPIDATRSHAGVITPGEAASMLNARWRVAPFACAQSIPGTNPARSPYLSSSEHRCSGRSLRLRPCGRSCRSEPGHVFTLGSRRGRLAIMRAAAFESFEMEVSGAVRPSHPSTRVPQTFASLKQTPDRFVYSHIPLE